MDTVLVGGAEMKCLFHGTRSEAAGLSILQKGLDRNRTTTAFHGKGVYCAANPSYAITYTDQTAPLQYLVLTCVLTGRPYTGVVPMNSMGLPPKYDSALVNQDDQDCFYVSFEDEKIYPAYLLELAPSS